MYHLQIIIAILATVNIIFAQPIGTGDSNEINKPPRILTQKELLSEAKNFQCKPQQRAILVQDLLKENNIMLETDEKISVINSIPMYRCDQQSGCCIRPGQICAELESEPVVLQFRAYKPDKTSRLIEINAFNHSKCACQNMTEIKRCDEMSGCCVNGMICAPKNITEIIYQFDVQHAFKKEYEHIRTIDVHVFNHTSCICRNSSTYVRNNTMDEPFVSNKTVDN